MGHFRTVTIRTCNKELPPRARRGLSLLAFVCLWAALPFGCAKAPPRAVADLDAGADGHDAALPDALPSAWTTGTSAELFAVDQVPQFEFTLTPDDWKWLQDNAIKEQYVHALATYRGQSAGLVGLRFKGSYGTLINCFDAAGKLKCPKLSFKVSFEEYDTQNRFYGLKKLNLHSMINDPTKLHEKLSYELFRLSDVAAPRSTWANIVVNGTSLGLFSMVEEVDGRFTDDRWPDNGNGNLFKEAWPTSASPAYYTERLATNKTTADTTTIVSFGREMTAATADGLATTLGKWTDLKALQRYMAVDDAIFNCDGVTALYTSGSTSQSWGNHNFYLYQEQQRDRFWLIPWDLDASLFVCAPFSAVPFWNKKPADCARNFPVWGGTWVKAPGCDPVFQAIAQDPAGYQAAVDALLAGPFTTQTLLDKIDLWSNFIRASVMADPILRGETGWAAAVTHLKNTIPVLRERLLAVRDGKTLTPASLSVTALNDFEHDSMLGITLGIEALANPNTDVTLGLNASGALAGTQDLRADFTYRDPGQPPDPGYQQWIYWLLNLAGGAQDLTNTAQIRLLMRSDRPRVVRVDLESDQYVAGGEGIKFGWDVPVTNTAQTIDLLLKDATLPTWARMTTDSLPKVRAHISGLALNPGVLGRDAAGFLGVDKSDSGFVEIDDIQFVAP